VCRRLILLTFASVLFAGVSHAQPQSTYQILHAFENPPWSPAGLVIGSDGALYGTTSYGGRFCPTIGCGTVFKVNRDGSGFRKLHDFDGSNGYGGSGLVKGSGAALYGWSGSGGKWGWGNLFRINEDGSGFATLHDFEGRAFLDPAGRHYAGYDPSSLVFGADGVLYGTTYSGGTDDLGTVFRIDQDGSGFRKIHDFIQRPNQLAEEGAYPSGLISGSDGMLYGTTTSGGRRNAGTVFRIRRDGPGFQKLHDFDRENDGESPNSLVEGPDRALYGLARGPAWNAILFKISLAGPGDLTGPPASPGQPCFCVFEKLPQSAELSFVNLLLIKGPDGALYGTADRTLFTIETGGSGWRVLGQLDPADDPPTALVVDARGVFYVGVSYGGQSGLGIIRSVSAGGSSSQPLYEFGWGYGAFPFAALLGGADGTLYGTTWGNVWTGDGTVFSINENGSGIKKLHDFDSSSSARPEGALVRGSTGSLYGTAYGRYWESTGGSVFRVNDDGSGFQTLHEFDASTGFDDGANPTAALVEGSDGALYGTTLYGGAWGAGVIFKIRQDGSGFQKLHDFDGDNGSWPSAALVRGSDGILLGTTPSGGSADAGIVFSIHEDGSGFQKLHDFDGVNGSSPGALTRGADGALYGTTVLGGASGSTPSGYGTIYRINADGSGFRTLHDFDGDHGAYPTGLLAGPPGVLHGTTAQGGSGNGGTLFTIHEDGSGFKRLHDFDPANGAGSKVIMGSDGAFYGTTNFGGPGGGGVVFRITVPYTSR
jgi:uncharacterized repeat protein (TIGR03803 family)